MVNSEYHPLEVTLGRGDPTTLLEDSFIRLKEDILKPPGRNDPTLEVSEVVAQVALMSHKEGHFVPQVLSRPEPMASKLASLIPEDLLLEGEAKEEGSDSQVGGRLLAFQEAWKLSSRWQKNIITNGLSWRWVSLPPPLKVPKFSPIKEKLTPFVEKFLNQGVIVKVPSQKCFQSKLFTVPKSSGSLRPILDLKKLNAFICTPTFKMSNHQSLREILPGQSWMAKLDIQDAYLHIPVKKGLQKFLAFTHGEDLFFFQALPFGLTSAPYIFSRMMAYPLQVLREQDIPVLTYLDDWILWESSPEQLRIAIRRTLDLLKQLGFLINWEKSELIPTQDITWLGVRWLTKTQSFCLPEQFQRKILDSIDQIKSQNQVTLRELEALQGILAFACQILQYGKLNAHKITRIISQVSRGDRDAAIRLPQGTHEALEWWVKANISTSTPLRSPPPSMLVWTDASNWGYGAHTDAGNELQGKWSLSQRSLHINAKELLAVLIAISSTMIPEGASVSLSLDNLAAYFVIENQGSNRSSVLQQITEDLFQELQRKRVHLQPHYIPGPLNVTADALSRDRPAPTEWRLSPKAFQMLNMRYGPLEVDLMATPLNRLTEVFISPYYHPEATSVDFFMTDLNHWRKIYIFPPVRMISRVLQRLLEYSCHGIIIAPWRPLLHWFPMLHQMAIAWEPLTEPPFQIVQGQKVQWLSRGSTPYLAWIF